MNAHKNLNFFLIFVAKFKNQWSFGWTIKWLINRSIFLPKCPLIFEFCAKYQQKKSNFVGILRKQIHWSQKIRSLQLQISLIGFILLRYWIKIVVFTARL
jgi:hypothetical protein